MTVYYYIKNSLKKHSLTVHILRKRIYENNTEATVSIQTEVEGYLKKKSKKRQSLYPKQAKSGNVNGGGGNDNDVGCGLLVYDTV